MIIFQHEPSMNISGYELIAVTRITLMEHTQSGALLYAGDKRPVAVICRAEDGEDIFDLDGTRIDAAALKALLDEQSRRCSESA